MITRKSPDEVKSMRLAGRVVAAVLEIMSKAVRPGVTTAQLDRLAEQEILRWGAFPAFKGYNGFPSSICTSVNEEVVHGIPGPRVLKEGDIVGVDVGSIVQGYYGDAAATFAVGEVAPEARRLMETTREALMVGISKAVAGNRIGDISHGVQTHVESRGYSVVRDLVGHGIGRNMHEEPQVPNAGPPGVGPRLRPGMTLAVEPMVNAGTFSVEVLEDGWTVVTRDRKLSAHFEHTILVTEGAPEILTLP